MNIHEIHDTRDTTYASQRTTTVKLKDLPSSAELMVYLIMKGGEMISSLLKDATRGQQVDMYV